MFRQPVAGGVSHLAGVFTPLLSLPAGVPAFLNLQRESCGVEDSKRKRRSQQRLDRKEGSEIARLSLQSE